MNTRLSLCSGIGGLDLGTPGRTVCYVEIDPFCQAVLGARMRDGRLDSAPIWPDIKTFPGMAWRGSVDLIVAGFPCQPHSTAGRRLGGSDSRDLWPEVRRVIGEVEPGVVFLENVAGLAYPSEGRAPYAATVVGQLAEMGYDARWGIVGARDAGASHRRDRWFCLAYARRESEHLRREGVRAEPAADSSDVAYRNGVRPVGGSPGPIRHDGYAQRGAGEHDAPVGTDDVADAGRSRIRGWGTGRGIGSASGAGESEGSERQRLRPAPSDGEPDVAELGDTTTAGRRSAGDTAPEQAPRGGPRLHATRADEGVGTFPPGPSDTERWGAILAERPDLAPAVEPALRGVADGPAGGLDRHRRRRLAALGNGVVPAQAALAWALLEGTAVATAVKGGGQ